MKQYCRYCSHLIYGDVCFCEKKNWVKSYDSCKQRNRCNEFEFNPIDALAENPQGYKPREKRININQQTLFDIEVLNERNKNEHRTDN